jgi:hypothetical protein
MSQHVTMLADTLLEILKEPGNAIRNITLITEALGHHTNNFPCVARPVNATNADCAELSAGRKGEQEAPHGED